MDPYAEVDSTLVFEKEMLKKVYEKVSPFVVAILLDPMSTGFIVKTSNTHNMIAVENNFISYGSETITVRYSDGITATVDHIERCPECNIAILHSRHLGKPRKAVIFGELENKECQKIVTLFPYKNDLMFFKGHITLTDCTSEDRSGSIIPGSENIFMLTCPVSASYELDRDVEREKRAKCSRTVLGAAVFDLDGKFLGRIYAFGTAHTLKYATKSSAFCAHLETPGLMDWQEETEEKEKHNANDLSSSDEEREPAPAVKKDKKRKKAKKGKTEAKQQVNGDGKLTARGENDPADSNALANFCISELLKAKLKSKGIIALLPIHATTFRLVLDGNDLVGRTCIGQEKTLAFVLPILESLVNGPHKGTRNSYYGRPPSVLVLLPTRELAKQVHADFKFYGGAFGLSTFCAYGGPHYCPQEIALRKGVDVVVGTPGHIKDLIVKGVLSLKCLKFHVLDEADEMVNMGFAEDVELILGKVGDVTKVQTLLFSATLPEWVNKLSMRFPEAEKRTLEHVSAPQPSDVAQCTGREAADAIASVSDSVIPVFRQQAEQLLSSSGMPAVDLLAKALAMAAGYTGTKKRSLLSSLENHTTLHLDTGGPMRGPGVALATLRRFMPEEKLSRVHGMALTADGTGAVFDVPSGEAQDYMLGAENAAGVTLDEVMQLPALQERGQSKGNSGFGRGGSSWWGGGGQAG